MIGNIDSTLQLKELDKLVKEGRDKKAGGTLSAFSGLLLTYFYAMIHIIYIHDDGN